MVLFPALEIPGLIGWRPGYDILAQAMGGLMAITGSAVARLPGPEALWGIFWAAFIWQSDCWPR